MECVRLVGLPPDPDLLALSLVHECEDRYKFSYSIQEAETPDVTLPDLERVGTGLGEAVRKSPLTLQASKAVEHSQPLILGRNHSQYLSGITPIRFRQETSGGDLRYLPSCLVMRGSS